MFLHINRTNFGTFSFIIMPIKGYPQTMDVLDMIQ